MRIIQIGPYPQSSDCIRGGVEASVYGLAQEQSKSFEVHVFDFPRISETDRVERDGNVIVHRFCNRGSRQISTVRQAKRVVQEILALSPDVCHIHGTGLFAWLIYMWLRNACKVVVTIHGLVLVEKRNLLKHKPSPKRLFQYFYQGMVEKIFLSQIPVAIVDTEYVKGMVEQYPIKKKPVLFVVPQGVNEDFFSLQCSAESNVLLSVGSMGERKGHLFTLKAFELLREQGIDCKLTIAGVVANQSYYERLCRAVDESVYKKDVELFIDLPSDKLEQLYQESHVFVLHSQEESQGIVFAEAMATGMPVVSTRVGGIPFVVQHEETGLLSDYTDVKSFAAHVGLILTQLNKWQSMSTSSKQKASEYHWSHISNVIKDIYMKL